MSTITQSQLTKIKTACSVLLKDLGGDVIRYSRFKASTAIRALEQAVENRGLGDKYRDELKIEESKNRVDFRVGRGRRNDT